MIIPNKTIYLYRHCVDMRKQINGLIGIIAGEMQLDPMSSALFVFIGKTGNKLKILQYETNCFWLSYGYLPKHKFKWPTRWFEHDVLTMSSESLRFLLQGCDLNGLKKFTSFTPKYAC
ncbi:MAG TPA: hypothetical protein DHW71_07380 [Gammaproteobacteria bacterium]|nr:hypothetical protein [Gammaproteobacteria bacterium]HCK92790.1 hypothetical protein [Gammaproteobacteria bacterium]|tara:strand:- start:1692 stop:2045 length:354 start_codon:yes stop_codon:yes gene_type:complete